MKSSSSVNKSIRKASTLQKPKAKALSVKEKATKSLSWTNIFDVSKARLSFSPRDFQCPAIKICTFSPAFITTFGLKFPPENHSSLLLSSLCGKSTSREFLFSIEKAILSGQSAMEYVNLYRADGEVLSCHITVRCIPSTSAARKEMQQRGNVDERWAILTVRSASVVGNANYVGIGLLGIDRIPQQELERVVGGEQAVQPEVDLLLSSNASSNTGTTY